MSEKRSCVCALDLFVLNVFLLWWQEVRVSAFWTGIIYRY